MNGYLLEQIKGGNGLLEETPSSIEVAAYLKVLQHYLF